LPNHNRPITNFLIYIYIEREREFTGVVLGPTPALMEDAVVVANATSRPIATYPTIIKGWVQYINNTKIK
jgi:hypothetical protein